MMESTKRARKHSKSSADLAKHKETSRSSLPPPLSTKSASRERVKSAPQLSEEPQKLKAHGQSTSRSTVPLGSSSTRAPTSPSTPRSRKSSNSWEGSNRLAEGKTQSGYQEVVIAVLGASTVGKSTFIQLALDLKNTPATQIASKKVSLEGLISVIRLVEVDVEDVEIVGERLHWPDSVGGHPLPAIDGVLLMYNVLDSSTTIALPPFLNSLTKDRVPTIIVASHCDNSPSNWRAEFEKIEKFCTRFRGIECFQSSVGVPETHKRCLSIILRNVIVEKHGKQPEAIARNLHPDDPRKSRQKPKSRPTTPEARRNSSQDLAFGADTSKYGRRGSEPLKPPIEKDEWTISADSPLLEPTRVNNESQSTDDESEPSEQGSDDETAEESQSTSKENSTTLTNSSVDISSLEVADHRQSGQGFGHQRSRSGNTASLASTRHNSIPEVAGEESSDEPKDAGYTFSELVDRLLLQPMSKADSNFGTIFLCLYRKFVAPSELLSAIVQRFEEVNTMDAPMLVQLTSQLRYLAIIRDWVADYQGDFAHPLTRRMMTSFMQEISSTHAFGAAHKEIFQHLEGVYEDDDTEWACADKGRSRASTMESSLTRSSAHSTASTLTADSSTEDIPDQSSSDKDLTRKSTRISSASSSASIGDRSHNHSSTSISVSLQSVESAQRQAQRLNPMPRMALDKIRWHQLMEIPDELIARELTRIDWILYSSVRPRDLIRHISLSAEQKANCKSLEHVNRIINQFNHVAFWVAHWILLRDKPKHRAKALEKFMNVAWKLRYLNNYNSLGAVVAGINGTSVHRLTQTRDLIDPQIQKQFMRLEILMGTQKGHFAYRLAWENTTSPRIPFLPLHRRDLVLAEEANRTYIPGPDGDLINWRKFEVMGQVIIEIRKSQQSSYAPMKRQEEVQRLLLDGAFSKEDDELYERSIQIEKPGAGEAPRRKFTLFTR